MAKTWATKCCSGTYKNNYQLCCGIKVYDYFQQKKDKALNIKRTSIQEYRGHNVAILTLYTTDISFKSSVSESFANK